MTNSKPFPARSVVTSFLWCEEALLGVLRVVPWCPEHKRVWSPMLTTVIMEACSQLDSLWGYTAWLSQYVRKEKKRNQLTIEDYFRYFANRTLTPLGDRWVVFWGAEPEQITPFESWAQATSYQKLEWWTAYNKLKHNRLENQTMATVEAAVNATAGLFQAIVAYEHCWVAVEAAGWLSASDSASHNPKAWLGEDSASGKDAYVLVETELFSYAVGWCNEEVKKTDEWLGNGSFRFKHWFREYGTD